MDNFISYFYIGFLWILKIPSEFNFGLYCYRMCVQLNQELPGLQFCHFAYLTVRYPCQDVGNQSSAIKPALPYNWFLVNYLAQRLLLRWYLYLFYHVLVATTQAYKLGPYFVCSNEQQIQSSFPDGPKLSNIVWGILFTANILDFSGVTFIQGIVQLLLSVQVSHPYMCPYFMYETKWKIKSFKNFLSRKCYLLTWIWYDMT